MPSHVRTTVIVPLPLLPLLPTPGEVMEAEVSEEARMREELASLKKRVACLEHQLVLKKPPEPLSFSVSQSIVPFSVPYLAIPIH